MTGSCIFMVVTQFIFFPLPLLDGCLANVFLFLFLFFDIFEGSALCWTGPLIRVWGTSTLLKLMFHCLVYLYNKIRIYIGFRASGKIFKFDRV